jgi:hypothetical protein
MIHCAHMQACVAAARVLFLELFALRFISGTFRRRPDPAQLPTWPRQPPCSYQDRRDESRSLRKTNLSF